MYPSLENSTTGIAMMYVVTSGPAKRRKQAALAYEQGVLTYVNVVVLAHAIKKRKCLYDMALCSAATV